MPPCLGSAASAIDEIASKDSATAAASGCTLRMVPSLELSASCGPIYRTIAWRDVRATREGGGPHWQFGLMRRPAAEQRDYPSRNASNFHLVAALEIETFTGLVRGRHLPSG